MALEEAQRYNLWLRLLADRCPQALEHPFYLSWLGVDGHSCLEGGTLSVPSKVAKQQEEGPSPSFAQQPAGSTAVPLKNGHVLISERVIKLLISTTITTANKARVPRTAAAAVVWQDD